MIRWTSPIDGWIQITGYVYMPLLSAPNRVTNWQILHDAEEAFLKVLDGYFLSDIARNRQRLASFWPSP